MFGKTLRPKSLVHCKWNNFLVLKTSEEDGVTILDKFMLIKEEDIRDSKQICSISIQYLSMNLYTILWWSIHPSRENKMLSIKEQSAQIIHHSSRYCLRCTRV